MKNILFTTGGTGGHIYPALAIAKEMKKRGYNILFVGTKYRMEKDLIKKEGFEFLGLDLIPIKSFKSLYKLFFSIIRSIKILRKYKIDKVIGFGNYISIPSLMAAIILRKEIYIQEQNIDFGIANKTFKRFAKKVFLAFPETLEKYNLRESDKIIVTGNPLREEFYNIQKENIENTLLITGGSLGAKNINDGFVRNIDRLIEENINVKIATGINNYDDVMKQLKDREIPNNISIKPYFEDMVNEMNKSTILICRAGALTISEIIEMNKPAIFIPYDYVGQNENADMLVEKNAGLKYTNEEVDKAYDKVIELLKNSNEINNMKNNLKNLNLGNAVQKIVFEITGEADGN